MHLLACRSHNIQSIQSFEKERLDLELVTLNCEPLAAKPVVVWFREERERERETGVGSLGNDRFAPQISFASVIDINPTTAWQRAGSQKEKQLWEQGTRMRAARSGSKQACTYLKQPLCTCWLRGRQ